MNRNLYNRKGLDNPANWRNVIIMLLVVAFVLGGLLLVAWNDDEVAKEDAAHAHRKLALREYQMVSLMEGRIGATGDQDYVVCEKLKTLKGNI